MNISYQQSILLTEIEDTGVGINDDDLRKLFKHFGKLKCSKQINSNGMGLGLSISKQIVEQLNGEIKVQSKAGQGTKFSFTVRTTESLNADPRLLQFG